MTRYTIRLAPPTDESVVFIEVMPDGEFMRFADHADEVAQLHASREALIGALAEAIQHVQQYDTRQRLHAALDAARAEEA